MVRIVFPTNQKMSYISPVESTFEDSKYLTILNVRGQNITAVETIKNPHPHSKEEIIRECKDNHFGVLILSENEKIPVGELKKSGVSVFTSNTNKTVLNTFSDFVQDKLKKVK
ncbi:hypothetical protein [Arcobacter sp. LA11]|uniref:hypothetical protein n=1 Tax=Arcobacter sp. LA11 TaxID=1898176 RepID=UPI0009326CF0|nr:hypothetical protein [Arcobacter sp. LA11]